MIKIEKLSDSDRKRKVIVRINPFVEKEGILLAWTRTALIVAIPTGQKKRSPETKELAPEDVSFADEPNP